MAEAARPVWARIATTLLFLASGSGFGVWAGCIPALKLRLDLSDSRLGLALLAFAGGAILAMPVAGFLAARWRADLVAMVAGILFALGLLLPGWAGNLAWLIAAALLMGMAQGGLDVAMNGHATEVERAWGGPIMSSFHAAFSLGGLAGAGLAGWLLSEGAPVWTTMGSISLAMGLLLLASWLLGANRGLPMLAATAAGPAFAWPSGAMWGIGGLTFLVLMFEGAIGDWSGVFLVTTQGASLSAGAAGYAAFAVAMVAGRLLGDQIVARLGEVRVMQLGGLLASAGLGLVLIVGQPLVALIGFAVVGLGLANTVPVLFSAAGRASPAGASVGVAMAATLGYGGFMLGPPIIGFAADLVGLRIALGLLVAGGALCAVQAASILGPRAHMPASRLAT